MGTIAKIKDGSNNTHLLASSAYGVCETPADTAAKVATIQDEQEFTLINGVTIHIKFTNTNTATDAPTLNVNGTGAKSIKKYGTTAIGSTTNTSWAAGEILSFTYDGTNWVINNYNDIHGIEYIIGTQTGATGSWTGKTTSNALYVGKTIAYKLPYAGSGNASLTLTLADGTTTSAIAIYTNTSRVTTHYGANSVVILVYDGTYWRASEYWNSNSRDAGYGKITPAQSTATTAITTTTAQIAAGTYNENLNINAGNKWIQLAAANGSSNGTDSFTIAHALSGATADTYGDSSNQTPSYGGTFKVPTLAVDAAGHITSISTHTVKIPASDNVNTTYGLSGALASHKFTTTLTPSSGSATTSDITLAAGSNITLTDDATNRKITIAATDTTYSVANAAPTGTSVTAYYPLFQTTKAGTSAVALTPLTNDDIKYGIISGTASTIGQSRFILGNGTDSGTAGNQQGFIWLYGEKGTKAHIIEGANVAGSDNVTHTFQDASGTIAHVEDTTISWDDTNKAIKQGSNTPVSQANLQSAIFYVGTSAPSNTNVIWLKPVS